VLDLSIIDPARRATPLPIIADPSHATGTWTLVAPMSRAALAAGAHGLLIEVLEPEGNRTDLKCDAEQAVPVEVLEEIVAQAGESRVIDLSGRASASVS
jgi:3-deoxy-7-phosphoheptulonate synthase